VEELFSGLEKILKMNPSEPSTSHAGTNNKRPDIMNSPLETTNHQTVTNNAMLNIGDLIKQIINMF